MLCFNLIELNLKIDVSLFLACKLIHRGANELARCNIFGLVFHANCWPLHYHICGTVDLKLAYNVQIKQSCHSKTADQFQH